MGKYEKAYLLNIALIVFCFYIFYNDYITFESRGLVKTLLFIGLLLFYPLLTLACFLRNKLIKIISLIVLIPISLIAWIPLLWLMPIDSWNGQEDMGFECIHVIPYNGDMIKVYRTNGGATTDYGVVVRKEIKLISGIILTKVYLKEYHQDSGGIEIIEGNM